MEDNGSRAPEKPKEYMTTLEGMEKQLTSWRRSGNSTRQIDRAVQIIFSGKVCKVLDHHEMGTNERANKRLFGLIMERICMEHPNVVKHLNIDSGRLEISLISPDRKERIDITKGGVDLNKA